MISATKREYIRNWKRQKRRKLGIYPKGQKPFCVNGHSRAVYKRHTKRDCLLCHRNRELARNRKLGAKPAVRRTLEERLLQRRKWEADRRARKRAAFVETVDPKILYARDHGICGICSKPVGETYEIDHRVPLSRGGEHSYANTQLAHPLCNRKKWAIELVA